MPLYQQVNSKLTVVKEKSFKLEKEIQTPVDSNLK